MGTASISATGILSGIRSSMAPDHHDQGGTPVQTVQVSIPAAEAALDGALDEDVRALAPASFAAVTHAGRVVAIRTYGSPRLDGTPTQPTTVFRIASMTKSFLAAAALGLRDEGRLDLNAPITEYVPGVVLRDGDETATVTAAQLLSNCSGLPEDNAWADRHLGLSVAEVAALAGAGLPLTRRPGTYYQYSNLGQSLVGRAVEAVTRQPVETVIRERLLDPLGLGDTRFTPDEHGPHADLAWGYRSFDKGEHFIREPYVCSGAMACTGGLFSTAADVAAWMWFLGSAFTDDPVRPDLLSPASRREMQFGRTPMPIGGDALDARLDARGYGYGLKVELDRRFGRIVSHSGGLPGFSSDMRWHAATGLGIVLFGNVDGFNKATRISEKALHRLLEAADAPAEYVRPWPETLHAAQAVDTAVRQGDPLASLGAVLSSNVLPDVPDDVRRTRLDVLLDEAGPIRPDQAPFAERILSAVDPAALRWRIACEAGALICDVRLMALSSPIIQTVNVQLADDSGRKPRDEAPLVADQVAVQTPS